MMYMKESNSLTQKFGMLTVLQEDKNEKGYPICLCSCDCGNTKTVYKSNLLSGRTKSCGCLEKANREKYNDLRGKRFGRLTAITPTDKRIDGNIVWQCSCDCGGTAFVTGRNLVRGNTKSCGCYLKEKQNIAGHKFGRLTALYQDKAQKKDRPRKWVCLCDCGGFCSVAISNLRNGHTKSCGCLNDIEYRNLIEGTCLELIVSKTISKNNRSGVKGVSHYSKTDSWIATLTFKGEHYYLGRFNTIAKAAQARWQAEEELIAPFIEQYSHLLSDASEPRPGCNKVLESHR